MKISLICVYNNEKQLREQLLASLKNQIGDIEKILLDSRKFGFTSAAQALNYGAEIATGDVLIFLHQDIFIKDKNGIEKFAKAIESTDIGDLTGIVGVRDKSSIYYTNLTDGPEFNEKIVEKFNKEELIDVSTVDEVMLGMRRETWEKHKFDDRLCDKWHLYAVEQSLYARKYGHHVFVYPIQAHHFSHGKITISYMEGLRKLCNAYRQDFKYIWTTCYKVRTGKIYINTLICIWVLNRKIHRHEL